MDPGLNAAVADRSVPRAVRRCSRVALPEVRAEQDRAQATDLPQVSPTHAARTYEAGPTRLAADLFGEIFKHRVRHQRKQRVGVISVHA